MAIRAYEIEAGDRVSFRYGGRVFTRTVVRARFEGVEVYFGGVVALIPEGDITSFVAHQSTLS